MVSKIWSYMELPRVTEILRCYTSYDKVPAEILNRAAARGSSVHAICAGIAKGAWIPDSMIEEAYKGYVDSFRQWSAAQVNGFEIVEQRYKDETLGYTGQLDFVIRATDGHTYLVDLKTSARPQKTYPVQMAAYENLLRSNGLQIKAAWIVYLRKNGEFPDIDVVEDFERHMYVFKCAIRCWKYFFKKKEKRGKETPEPGCHEVEEL